MTNTKNLQDKANGIVAKSTTAQLATMLLATEQMRSNVERGSEAWQAYQRTFLWIADEIERRHEVNEAMEAWAADLDTEMTYAEALIAALPVSVL